MAGRSPAGRSRGPFDPSSAVVPSQGGGAAQVRPSPQSVGSRATSRSGAPSAARHTTGSSSMAEAGPGTGAESRGPPPPVTCAASRLAQSWNVGHAENEGVRQYSCWCAIARGAGSGSA